MEILTRPAKAQDLNFVFDSWMKSWRVSKWSGTIPNHLYYETQRTLIEDLIARGAKIVIAYPEGYDETILGWACGEEKAGKAVLHYVYVKDPFLGLGIPTRLVSILPGTKPGFVTHVLPYRELSKWQHTPEMARRKVL